MKEKKIKALLKLATVLVAMITIWYFRLKMD